MGPTLASVTVGFFVLAIVFGALERLFPAVKGRALLRAGTRTDVLYWLSTPLVTKALTRFAVAVAVVALAVAYGARLDRESILRFFTERRTAVGAQPLWLQTLEVLVLADLLGYATHRLLHASTRLWAIHAVHHSSTELDWLASVRVHPLNDVIPRVAQALVLIPLGFHPLILAAYAPFIGLYALLLHANVPWTFGPLRYVIASPAFHRWHHELHTEGKNFAGLFPWIDLALGTFHVPTDRAPERFGIEGSPVPEGFLAQLVYPFRRARQGAAKAAAETRVPSLTRSEG